MNIHLKDISKSKTVHGVLIGLCVAVIALLIFQAGIFVGYKKAQFLDGLGDNYSHTFGGRGSFTDMVGSSLEGKDLPGGHGAAGRIIQINSSSLVLADSNNIEKVVDINAGTMVRGMPNTMKVSDLKVDDFVIVIGSPDGQGNIIAKLIRVLPPVEESLAPEVLPQ